MATTYSMVNDKKEIFGWAMYDWANSAFSTTVGTVFLGPYVASLARAAAEAANAATVSFLGVPVAPDSFLPYCISFSVGMQVLFLPILGGIADYSHLRKQMLQTFATLGAAATILLFLVTGSLWWLGGLLFVIANLSFGAAIVFYNAYLPDIATENERDRVSSFGWAMGYMGGGILLALNLAFFTLREQLGVPTDLAENQSCLRRIVVAWFFILHLGALATPPCCKNPALRRDLYEHWLQTTAQDHQRSPAFPRDLEIPSRLFPL